LAVFLTIAVTQSPPTIDDDFTGDVSVVFLDRGRQRHLEGLWYFDHTGKQDKVSGLHNATEVLDLWRVWNSTTGGSEWIYRPAFKHCEKNYFTENFYGLWDFLPHSKASGDCHHYKDSTGTQWTAKDTSFNFEACISKDGKTPLWVDIRFIPHDRNVFVMFHQFTAGRPAPSFFTRPDVCPK